MFVVLFPADAAANISASRTSTGFDLAGIEHPVGRSRSALYSQRKRQTGSRKKNKRAEAGGDSASVGVPTCPSASSPHVLSKTCGEELLAGETSRTLGEDRIDTNDIYVPRKRTTAAQEEEGDALYLRRFSVLLFPAFFFFAFFAFCSPAFFSLRMLFGCAHEEKKNVCP